MCRHITAGHFTTPQGGSRGPVIKRLRGKLDGRRPGRRRLKPSSRALAFPGSDCACRETLSPAQLRHRSYLSLRSQSLKPDIQTCSHQDTFLESCGVLHMSKWNIFLISQRQTRSKESLSIKRPPYLHVTFGTPHGQA